MKSHTEYLTFNIPTKMAFANITSQVQDAVRPWFPSPREASAH
jgi:hypothetical protein